jgi:hypothetical protein
VSGCPFAKGDVVVCIDAAADPLEPNAVLLAERRVYRVGAVGNRKDGAPAVAFRAIPSNRPGRGWAFRADRFRKIENDTGLDFRHRLRSLGKQNERVSS